MILGNEYIVPYFSDLMRYVPEKVEKKSKMKKGSVYSLPSEECDGFVLPQKKYKYIDYVNEIDGVTVDSVILKQVEGENSSIFSLTKNDCRKLGIEFEQGLQLFPKSMGWTLCERGENNDVEREIEFDSQNLSTYPVDFTTKTIRRITIKMSGFNVANNSIFTNDSQYISTIGSFSKILFVTAKENIGGENINEIKINRGSIIIFRIVTQDLSITTNGVVDMNGNIFIELVLEHVGRDKNIYGLFPSSFRNRPFEDFFEIHL